MPVELLLFGMLIVTAWAVARITDLFGAAMLTGLFSLLSAGLFVLMDAVDVAFTEAAVGAGISTVLILATLGLTRTAETQQTFRVLPVIAVLVTGGALLVGTTDMPHYGAADAPIHTHVAPGYIEGTEKTFKIPNVVTAVLGSYRGFDTLGETGVIFTAGVGVMLLLGGRCRRKGTAPANDDEEEASP
jgi:multicomponent Na+:H+ antiporter subunit B